MLHATKYTTVCVNSSATQGIIWLDRAHGDVRVTGLGVVQLYSARVSNQIPFVDVCRKQK